MDGGFLQALSKGETDADQLAELGDVRLQGSLQEVADALRGSPEPSHLALWKLRLERLQLLEGQIEATEPDERHGVEEA